MVFNLRVQSWIFKDLVHQNDELTHDGSKGDLGGFTSGALRLPPQSKIWGQLECSMAGDIFVQRFGIRVHP